MTEETRNRSFKDLQAELKPSDHIRAMHLFWGRGESARITREESPGSIAIYANRANFTNGFEINQNNANELIDQFGEYSNDPKGCHPNIDRLYMVQSTGTTILCNFEYEEEHPADIPDMYE